MSGGQGRRARLRKARARRLFAGAEAELVPQGRMAGPKCLGSSRSWCADRHRAGDWPRAGQHGDRRNGRDRGRRHRPAGRAACPIREQEAARALDALKAVPGVASIRLVPQEELDALVAPWLGSGAETASGGGYPGAALIDVRLQRAASAKRVAAIQRTLARRGAIRVGRCASELAQAGVRCDRIAAVAGDRAGRPARGRAGGGVLLAARSALGTHRDTIEIVHLLGGTDAQIARVFQRSIGFDAAGGGASAWRWRWWSSCRSGAVSPCWAPAW